MKAYFNQLPGILGKGLAQFYLVSGDEPLQRMEAADMIRAKAVDAAYAHREFFFAGADFDWSTIELAVGNLSLFAEQRLIDLRLQTAKLPPRGTAFLKAMLDDPPAQTLFMVQAVKVDGRSAWVKRVAERGVWVQVYGRGYTELRAWLTERALRNKLTLEDGVIDLIAQRVEGNMLAAAQEIEKLVLSCGGGTVRLEDVERTVGDSAHYSVYNLGDAVIGGDGERAMRILHGLRAEAAPEPLVLWALTDQVRKMVEMERRIVGGERPETVLRAVWKSKQPVYRKALARGLGRRWWGLLYACYEVDKAVKGRGVDAAWNELTRLVMRGAGIPALRRSA